MKSFIHEFTTRWKHNFFFMKSSFSWNQLTEAVKFMKLKNFLRTAVILEKSCSGKSTRIWASRSCKKRKNKKLREIVTIVFREFTIISWIHDFFVNSRFFSWNHDFFSWNYDFFVISRFFSWNHDVLPYRRKWGSQL